MLFIVRHCFEQFFFIYLAINFIYSIFIETLILLNITNINNKYKSFNTELIVLLKYLYLNWKDIWNPIYDIKNIFMYNSKMKTN